MRLRFAPARLRDAWGQQGRIPGLGWGSLQAQHSLASSTTFDQPHEKLPKNFTLLLFALAEFCARFEQFLRQDRVHSITVPWCVDSGRGSPQTRLSAPPASDDSRRLLSTVFDNLQEISGRIIAFSARPCMLNTSQLATRSKR
jgi:hypothetical protein